MDFEDCCNPIHHRIQNFADDGTFITKWGGNGAFVNPMGIAIDSTGDIYVVDQVHQRIAKFTSDGTFIKDWGSGYNPTDIAIDSSDNVYVTEMYDSRIAKFTSDGTFIKRWNTGPICRGIAVDSHDTSKGSLVLSILEKSEREVVSISSESRLAAPVNLVRSGGVSEDECAYSSISFLPSSVRLAVIRFLKNVECLLARFSNPLLRRNEYSTASSH